MNVSFFFFTFLFSVFFYRIIPRHIYLVFLNLLIVGVWYHLLEDIIYCIFCIMIFHLSWNPLDYKHYFNFFLIFLLVFLRQLFVFLVNLSCIIGGLDCLFIIYILWCFNLVEIWKVKMILMIYILGKFEHRYCVVLPYMFSLHNGLPPL